ncbi:hypothetical protein DFQ28_003460 [Apophysomyces sp. BC1034]|nr:hypothetical protein DFQ28_003460 [Apophysomyces sp. BC1034]
MTANRFRQAIARQLARISASQESQVISLLGSPKPAATRQFCLPVPKLVATLRDPPSHVAQWTKELSDTFRSNDLIKCATASGQFLHFDVQLDEYVQQTLLQIHKEDCSYGSVKSISRPTMVIDYSSPNIAKPFHAGHLRSTILGNFIKRVHEAMGYNVVGINYLGDWGKQYGLLAVGFERYGDETKLMNDPIHHLYEVYVKINADATKNAEIDRLANEYFSRMEKGDKEALKQWLRFRELSIVSYKSIYKRLNIEFEHYSGESQVESYIPKVYQLLEQRDLIKQTEDGAWIVDLEDHSLGKAVVRRADGTSLYLTRDLASLMLRQEKFAFDKAIYTVGTEQEFYLKQLFKVSQLMFDAPWCENLHHAKFGRVQGMSTRKGTVVFLQDILDTAKEKMLENMLESNQFKFDELTCDGIGDRTGQDAVNYVADTLGTSAVIVQDMVGKRIKNYSFSWDRMTSARGYTGVYLQFTYARLCG